LPLDPGYPPERLRFMLDDAAPALVLTTAATNPAPDGQGGVPTLLLDDAGTQATLATRPGTDPTDEHRTSPLTAEHPAYVIYTSGSTGVPKGVTMAAGALVNLLAWHHKALGGSAGTKTAQFSAISFDASAQEILSALGSPNALGVLPGGPRGAPDAVGPRWAGVVTG